MNLSPSQKIYLAPSGISNAGRGVFAAANIHKDEVIERCPIIKIEEKEMPLLKQSELLNYYFMWGEKLKEVAICLGFGSLYNHSYEPNAKYKKITDEDLIDFVAIKDIKKGEEITVNYNYGEPSNKKPLWIKSIPPPQNK